MRKRSGLSLGLCLMLAWMVCCAAARAQDERLGDGTFDGGLEEPPAGLEDGGIVQPPRTTMPPGAPPVRQSNQPPATPQPPRSNPPPRALTGRERGYRLASVPNMLGDFFGNGPVFADVQGPPVTIRQTFTDGAGIDFKVFNALGLPGPSLEPNVPILLNGAAQTMSIAPGQDFSGDQQPDVFAIAEPIALAPGMPGTAPLPGPGTIVFNNGVAVFTAGKPIPDPNADPTQFAEDNSLRMSAGWSLALSHVFTPDRMTVVLPSGGGAAVRRVKLSEDNSPQPRSRVFFTYNFFNDAYAGIGDVNRYVFGVEHAFFDNWASIDVRVPFASTLAAEQGAVPGAALHDTEFGNLTAIGKVVLVQGERGLLSAGLGVAAPTADDGRLTLPNGQTIVEVWNQGVHLLPFAAILANATDRFFWQAFVQFDVDVNGNPVQADVTGANLTSIGVLQDQTLLFVDVGAGYRLYQNPQGALQQVAALAELHYATTLQDFDVVAGNGVTVRGATNRFDVLNATFGADFLLRGPMNIRPAIVLPLRDGDDEQFDYEAAVQVNIAY